MAGAPLRISGGWLIAYDSGSLARGKRSEERRDLPLAARLSD
ncbi:hypothetical protein BN12_60026 [Nostocoides japonicum T1-X7]|uniref:Uncharacterized protein n=1 Tax=Nostocoides japonicum T1-X7 TaxID=1194083 RepID=A0A077M6Z9_9MICO|nr:hypothetical protein BN12_60026 [Tetrasphaera japonica T1-X7]